MTQNKNLGRVSVEDAIMDDTEVGTTVAHAIADGKAMADDGQAYDSAQDAVDNATNWVWLPPNTTFRENVTITTQGLTIKGSGYTTLVDANDGPSEGLRVESDNVTIRNLSVKSDPSLVDAPYPIQAGPGNNTTINSVTVRDAGDHGIVAGHGDTITNCVIEATQNGDGILPGDRAIVARNIINAGAKGMYVGGSDTIVANNIIIDSGIHGIQVPLPDCVIIGNRIINSGADGIDLNSNDVIVANNRISDSSGTAIENTGSGNVLDSNLTGGAN